MEYVAVVNGQFTCSDGALIQCPHCNTWYWVGWYPRCSCGKLTSQTLWKEENGRDAV